MSEALQFHISEINNIIERADLSNDFKFSGFDSSAAPSKDCESMTTIYEKMGVEYFGASVTVEASSLLTKVFKSLQGVNLIGFSGLMLALTEDTGLADGTLKSNYDIRSLLTYSITTWSGLSIPHTLSKVTLTSINLSDSRIQVICSLIDQKKGVFSYNVGL